MIPPVDVLVVLHNCRKLLPGLVDSLRGISIPIRLHLLDNNSTDGTAGAAGSMLVDLPFPSFLTRSLHNNGFARGMNLLAKTVTGEFMFILNPDTEVEPGALEALVRRMQSDPKIGIVEARQSPKEHPKAYDPVTGETTWCSGAAALIRRTAFEAVEGFDERLFFMYCEDVDFSWKLWLRGWKCIYVPEAVVRHFTQELLPGKRRTLENYFSFRNSMFLLYRFGAGNRWSLMRKFLRKRFFSSDYSLKSRVLFGIAFVDHIRYIPYLLHTRDTWSSERHRWIRFEETSLSH